MVKNYTSQVPASRSVQHIEDCLIKHGAKNIIKMIDNKKISGIAFVIAVNGKEIPFKLPSRVQNVEKQLKGSVKRPNSETYNRISEQAERTAWKLLSDWVDVQMSLVELSQIELMEVFLPYVYDPAKEQTLFEKMKGDGFSLLEYKSR